MHSQPLADHCSRPFRSPPRPLRLRASMSSVHSSIASVESPPLSPVPASFAVMHDIEEMMSLRPEHDDDDEHSADSRAPNAVEEEAARLTALQTGLQHASSLRGLSPALFKVIAMIESVVAAETEGARKGRRKSKTAPAASASAPPMRFDSFHSMGQMFAVPLAEGDADDVEALQHGAFYSLGSRASSRSSENKLLLHVETHPRVLSEPDRFGLPVSSDPSEPALTMASRHITKRKRQARAKKLEQAQAGGPLAFVGLYFEKPAAPKAPQTLLPVACEQLLEDGCIMLRSESQARQLLCGLMRAVIHHESQRKTVDDWALAYRIKEDGNEVDEEEAGQEIPRPVSAATISYVQKQRGGRTRRSRVAED